MAKVEQGLSVKNILQTRMKPSMPFNLAKAVEAPARNEMMRSKERYEYISVMIG
jgi:hypothetical protein